MRQRGVLCVNAEFVVADDQSAAGQHPRTKVKNLVALGVSLDLAIKHAVSRKKYWRMSRTPALRYAMPNEWLAQQGLLSLKHL